MPFVSGLTIFIYVF